MAKSQQNFTISVPPYNGDSDYTTHFFDLIKQNAIINKWSNDQMILFVKSKLAGAALKMYLESPDLQCSDDISSFENAFKTFFQKHNDQFTITDFNNLTFMPDESVRHFCHRLHVLTTKVYKNVSDSTALDSIKLNKLLSVLPANIRIKLLEEKVTTFNKAMERAHEIQSIYVSEFQPKNNNCDQSAQTIFHLSAQVSELQQKLEALNKKQSVKRQSNEPRPSNSSNFISSRNNRYQNFSHQRPYRSGPNIKQIKCQLCFKFGHTANRCYRYRQNYRNLYNRRNRHSERDNSHNRNNNENVENNDNLNL